MNPRYKRQVKISKEIPFIVYMQLVDQFPAPLPNGTVILTGFTPLLPTQGLSVLCDLKGYQQGPAFVLQLPSHCPGTWPDLLPLQVISVPLFPF